jgi:putative NADH-flavin reductase
MRITLFGANGPTGHQLTEQALAAGHEVVAVTRRPRDIAPRNGLTTAGADVADPDAVHDAIAGCDAVVSALGVPYSSKPITVYSVGAANIIAAMANHGVKRLVVAGTAAVDAGYQASDSLFFSRVMQPLFMRKPGRTLYEDNRRMEELVRDSELDWTIVRACWLFNSPGVTDYQVTEGNARGMFTARTDFAACMLAQLADEPWVRKTIGVTTTTGTPRIVQQIWHEGIKKEKKP